MLTVTIRQQGNDGPLLLWPTFPHRGNEIDHMWECLQSALPGENFTLAAIHITDWNRQLSPWAAPPAFGEEAFAGEGPETLREIQTQIIPALRKEYGDSVKIFLLGYSLAGLFALWAAYECECFDGIVSGSGSLWFPGWDIYAESHRIRRACRIYLSLGGKEEKTRNRVMAAVGDRTRRQEILLREDPAVEAVTLEWNPGGHFADAEARLVKGVSRLFS